MKRNELIQIANFETPIETPSTYLSGAGVAPAVYELRRSQAYHGLTSPSVCSPFTSFPIDSLYQFPLVDGQSSTTELRALISSSLLANTKSVDLNSLLTALHNNSPFKRTSNFSPTHLQQSSNLYSNDSISFHYFGSQIIDESFIEESSEFIKNSFSEISALDEEAINQIKEIQRNFHSRPENENNLQSLSPASLESDSPNDYSQNISGLSIPNSVLNQTSELMAEECKAVEGSSLIGNSDEFCISLAEEGRIQLVKCTMECEDSASKNILTSVHPKPELVRLSQKSLGSLNSPYASIVQELSNYHPSSPILRKLVFCRALAESPDSLEIVASVATSGFAMALGLEYSNIEVQNKACVDYKRSESILINNSIARAMARNKAMWVSCGFEHCVLVTLEGKLMSWGYGASGCLGHGDTVSCGFPKLIQSTREETCRYVECGGYHSLAITDSSEVLVWGRGDVHQLGLPYRQLCKDEYGHVALRPIKLDFLKKKTKGAACGEAHTLILDEDGAVLAFGWGEDGQLGMDLQKTEENKEDITHISFSFGSNVIKVAAGHIFSACLTESGNVFVWGNAEKGQFAKDVEEEFMCVPQRIGIEKVIDIVCGESCVLCVTQNGEAYGWGLGKAGYFSSQSQNFRVGSELVCFSPKLLGEADVIHHFLI